MSGLVGSVSRARAGETAELDADAGPLVVVRAGRPPLLDVAELWKFRELFWTLATRTVLSRYKQSFGGVFWGLLRPIMTVVFLTVIFNRVSNLPAGGVPYPLLVLLGVVPWTLFSVGVSNASNSLIQNTRLVTKTYFPRIILPVSAVVIAFIEFCLAMVVLIPVLLYFRESVDFTWGVFLLPAFVLLAIMTAIGVGFWLSALNVFYRDVRQVVSYITGFGLLLSPVGFRSLVISPEWHLAYAINPMVTVIEGFRFTVINQPGLTPESAAVSVTVALTLFVGGYLFFRRLEPRFADVI